MTHNEVLALLTDIFRDVFEAPDLILTPETTSEMIPQWDSMAQVTLAVEIEHRFGIKVKAAEMEELKTITDLMSLIERRLPAHAG